MDIYLQAYLPRVAMSVVFAAVVWVTPYVGNSGEFPIYYYIIILLFFGLHQVYTCTYTMVVKFDHAIGGFINLL